MCVQMYVQFVYSVHDGGGACVCVTVCVYVYRCTGYMLVMVVVCVYMVCTSVGTVCVYISASCTHRKKCTAVPSQRCVTVSIVTQDWINAQGTMV